MSHRLEGKPLLFDAAAAISGKIITWLEDRSIEVHLPTGEKKRVLPEAYFDLVPPTMLGLEERLTHDEFSPLLHEEYPLWDFFKKAYAEFLACNRAIFPASTTYGTFAFYPQVGELVRYAPKFWHRVNLVASSGALYRDVERTLSWQEVRERLSSFVVGIAGCSVGSSVIHALVSDLRPDAIKIADKSRYKMENTNRVRITYREILDRAEPGLLAKKVPTVAAQLYALDPYLDVFAYEEGITADTISSFFGGDNGKEPALNLIIDEVDDPGIKILLREEARRRKVPLLMVTDVGSIVQLDIRRFDLDPTLSLTHGTLDAELYAAHARFERLKGDRTAFFEFVDALIGTTYRQGELGEILSGHAERPSQTLFAQLGSTVMVAGGIAAEATARLCLGYPSEPRVFFDKRSSR